VKYLGLVSSKFESDFLRLFCETIINHLSVVTHIEYSNTISVEERSMVKFQRKSYNHFNEDVESVASIGQKSGIIFGRKGNLSTSNFKDVSTLHTKGSLIRVVKVICSFTCARFLMIIALYNLYIANMRAFDDATGGIYALKAEERHMRQVYFQYEKQITEAMNLLDGLQRNSDQESANSVQESAVEEKLNIVMKNNDYREQIIEDLQTHVQNSHRSQLETR